MKLGGLEPFSLSDFPGRVSAVVFTQGCNFRCPFCHNGSLLSARPDPGSELTLGALDRFLEKRRGRLDGVVVSGGEPTLHDDLPRFLTWLKSMGIAVKLDTNGSMPDRLEAILRLDLVDFVAMDVKAPLEKYDRLAGAPVDVEAIERSMSLIAASGVNHQFRTTHVPSLLDERDLDAIAAMIPAGSPHRIQPFVPDHALDPSLRPVAPAERF